MKYSNKIFISAVVASFLVGCGGGSSKASKSHEVTVERAPVINAVVIDAKNNIAKNKPNTNVYVFDKDINYPITVKNNPDGSTFMDLNNDGKADSNDVELNVELQSCNSNVTMVSTLVAKQTSCDATKTKEKYDALSHDLNISVDDLKALPSKSSVNAVILNNAIYASLVKHTNTTLDLPSINEEIAILKTSLHDKQIDIKTAKASDIEKIVIKNLQISALDEDKIHQANNKNSIYVKNAIDILETIDYTKDDIASKIKKVKDELSKAPSDDKDAKVANALVNLVEVANTNCLANFINFTNVKQNYQELLPSLLFVAESKNNAKSDIKNAGNIQNCSNDVLQGLVEKTLKAEDSFKTTFSDDKYLFKHKDVIINHEDSKAIRSSALFAAATFQIALSYDKDINSADLVSINEEFDYKMPWQDKENKYNVTYKKMDVYPLETYYNKPNAFNMDLSKLQTAKTYLTNSATLLKDVKVNELKTVKQTDTERVNDFKTAQKYAQNLLENLKNGKSSAFVVYDRDDNIEAKYDLKIFFEKGLKKSDFTKDKFEIVCDDKNATFDEKLSKIWGGVNCNSKTYNFGAKILAKTLPSSSESNLDDVVLEAHDTYYDNGIKTKILKGDDLIKDLWGK